MAYPSAMACTVVYAPGLSESRMCPVGLATGFARCGYGKVVRVDYAPAAGAFVYVAYGGGKLSATLRDKGTKGLRVALRSAVGRPQGIRLLPAHGWENGVRTGPPAVLTDDVITYDVDCPDAGEGSWMAWERKVTALDIVPGGAGFADPYESADVALMRERRWRATEDKAICPLCPWLGPLTLDEIQGVYGDGIGTDLFALLRETGACSVRTLDVVQSPVTSLPPPSGSALVGQTEATLRKLERRLGVRGLPARAEPADTIPPGLARRCYRFSMEAATGADWLAVERELALLRTLVGRWGGTVVIRRQQ